MDFLKRPAVLLLLVAIVAGTSMAIRHLIRDPFPAVQTTLRNHESGATAASGRRPGDPALAETIRHTCESIREDASGSDAALHALRERLFQGDRSAAAAAAVDFLRSGRDASTQQPFATGPEGTLLGTPTLRTALLDWLPALDPGLSLAVSREILQATDSPDEYALALRNLAWNDLNGDLRPELSAAFRQMLDNRRWRENPSAGYLEAFDLAVELGGLSTFLSLEPLASPDSNPDPLVHASCMSMDRMIVRDPSLLSGAWRQSADWMAEAPLQRASLMSRLDITQDDHRAVFVEYLGSSKVGDAERETFLELFPNGNHLHGDYLITRGENPPDIDARAEMDRNILREIDTLCADAAPHIAQALQKARSRMLRILGEQE